MPTSISASAPSSLHASLSAREEDYLILTEQLAFVKEQRTLLLQQYEYLRQHQRAAFEAHTAAQVIGTKAWTTMREECDTAVAGILTVLQNLDDWRVEHNALLRQLQASVRTAG